MNLLRPGVDVCQGLIDIETACTRAVTYVTSISETESIAVHLAGGRTLAEDISAEVAMPPFDQSAMDGYAVAVDQKSMLAGARLPVAGRVAAGEVAGRLLPGHAVRVFTGAPLPLSADAVLMQEHCWCDGKHIVLHREVQSGDNVRRRGEDIERGDFLLRRGTRLDARHVALLSAQGLSSVMVCRRLRVGVISTGNELVQPGSPLARASIYDSNRPMIMTLAAQAGLDVFNGGWVRDDPKALATLLREISGHCDFVVTTGGVSVGEEDHCAAAVALAEGDSETLKVALKPGKPALVGRVGRAAYLGLPGNPVSALVSWFILGRAVIAALDGRVLGRRLGCSIPAFSRFERRAGRTEFVPGRIVTHMKEPAVEILGRGGSTRLRPLVEADGLVEIQPHHAPVNAGEKVLFHLFRYGLAV